MSFNKILRLINFSLLLFSLYLFNERGENEFINQNTIILGSLLAIQIHTFLVYENRRNVPLLTILCFQLIFYYLMRVISLTFIPFSVVFNRYTITVEDVNFGLFYIILSNLFIFAGIWMALNAKKLRTYGEVLQNKSNVYKILGFFLLVIILGRPNLLGIALLDRLFDFIKLLFLNPSIILFIIIVFFTHNFGRLTIIQRIIFAATFAGYIVYTTLSGSRSAALVVFMYALFATLAGNKKLVFQVKHLLLGLIMVPVMIFVFIFATDLRRYSATTDVSNEQKLEVIKNSLSSNAWIEDEGSFGLIFDRIGFLDYATEIIAHKEQYSSIFNISYYIKSIVDNFLTPGFTVFDTPKVSNALVYKYFNYGVPSLKTVDEYYASDQVTMYGEYFALLGWGSLVAFILTGYFFQSTYLNFKYKTNMELFIKRALLINIFYVLINSFGLDWLLFDSIAFYLTFILFRNMFLSDSQNA